MLRIIRLFSTENFLFKVSSRRELFDKEFNRVYELNKRRLEKITVNCQHLEQKLTLTMNKNISTPIDCARHIQEYLVKKSVLALVNGSPFDMNRTLSEDCELKFIDFHSDNCFHVNLAFWRSCSFLTNWILENCFHDDFQVNLCSFPPPNLKSGSFVCDIQISYKGQVDFDPDIFKSIDLRSISTLVRKSIFQNYNFIPLSVDQNVATSIFKDSPLKLKQIPMIFENLAERDCHPLRITLYKIGNHVDICQGPLISCTSHIGRYKLTSIYPINTEDYGRLYRVQGIAIPVQLPTHDTTFQMISKRAEQPNQMARIPELKRKCNTQISKVTSDVLNK